APVGAQATAAGRAAPRPKRTRKKENAMLKLENVSKVFRAGEVETTALDRVDLRISAGEFVAIMGPSGCGKSTLLNVIGLLDNPTSGAYRFLDEEVSAYTERKLARVRKHN